MKQNKCRIPFFFIFEQRLSQMKRHSTLLFLMILALLTSCQIEKRLYTGGYYISKPEKAKFVSATKPSPDDTKDVATAREATQDREEHIIESTEESEVILPTAEPSSKKNGQKLEKKITTDKLSFPIEPNTTCQRDDDGKIKKDIWQLLAGSVLVFLFACLYEVFLGAGSMGLANLFFILTPFGIIAIWIFALLLRTKYKQEDELNNPERKTKKERVITQRKAFLLSGFLGIFGGHRFYLGYTWIGILQMLTLGGGLVFWFIDFLRIKNGNLKPKKGDYDKEPSSYSKGKSKKTTSKPLQLILVAALISLAALLLIALLAIF